MSPSVLSRIRSDAWRIYGNGKWSSILKGLITNRSFKPLVTLRLCQSVARAAVPFRQIVLPVFAIGHRLARHYSGMDLPWQTEIGLGFSIQHGWGAVINSRAKIGNNVTLYHGVTIGQADRIASDGSRSTGYPVIEDEVWIGPHVIIVGGITVGEGSRIAGGAFVTHDIPAFSLVSGNPAMVVRQITTSDVRNPYPLGTRVSQHHQSIPRKRMNQL